MLKNLFKRKEVNDQRIEDLENRVKALEDIYETLKVRVQVEERKSEVDKRKLWLRGDKINET